MANSFRENIFRFISFVLYFFRAETKFDVHSPLVFDFINNVLEEDKWYYCFNDIEQLRSVLLSSEETMVVTDFGAGSQVLTSKQRKIKDIAANSLSTPYFCQILFSLTQWLKPKKVLELGTSLGVSTLYISKSGSTAEIITIEGCNKIAEKAAQAFKLYNADNIKLINGDFDSVLVSTLKESGKTNLFVIDGNHRKQATLRYFEQCLAHADEKAVFVFDDIYWSAEMAEAWQEIKSHPKSRLTIDIFQYGLVFLHDDVLEKQHFTLIDSKYKFWRTGLFA